MRRPEVKERFAASLRRERAIRMLLESVGGVDFAALEAEAAAAEAALEDPVDEVVSQAEMAAEMEQVVEALGEAQPAIEALAEAEGISQTEAALEILSSTAAMIEATAEAGLDPDSIASSGDAAAESAATDGETRQVPGDTSA